MENKLLTIAMGMVLLLVLPMISAAEVSVCCEKTLDGAYCQNSPAEECDTNFLSVPTSCEATSFCQKGCCYDSDEGLCMENTPEEACTASNGAWSEEPECGIPQCNLGCCILGEQAAFTTLQRCKKLSGFYGLQADFRTDVSDELSCIALANTQDVGACVFEEDFITTCKFTTRGECNSITSGEGVSIKFNKNYLCTAPELSTNCERTQRTTCVDGRDGVYFADTCGNPANIYDASMVNSIEYWTKVKKPSESCGADTGNINSDSCGNCDYLGGSICSDAGFGNSPDYGDYICKDLNCYDTSNGKDYKNGESWCYSDDERPNTDSAGSRYYRHVCFMGEETVEACDDFRNQICVEEVIGDGIDFSQAGCVVNKWHDCALYSSSIQEGGGDAGECLNSDKHDCMWIPFNPETGTIGINIERLTDIDNIRDSLLNIRDPSENLGACVPKVAPGLMFWDESAVGHCSAGSQSCIVKFEKGLLGDKECVENCPCIEEETAFLAMFYCSSLGDCGPGKNYIGKFTKEGYEIEITRGQERAQEVGGAASPGGADFDAPREAAEFGGSGGGEFQGSGNVIQGFVTKIFGGGNE